MLTSAWWSLSFSFLLVLLHCPCWGLCVSDLESGPCSRLLMNQLVSCVLVVWGLVVLLLPFFPPKVILPLDHVLGLVCHLGVVVPPQWVTNVFWLEPDWFNLLSFGLLSGGTPGANSQLGSVLHRWSVNLHPRCWPWNPRLASPVPAA